MSAFVWRTSSFKSTPSVGRATRAFIWWHTVIFDFNPRPPWGGRPRYLTSSNLTVEFQSTPSVGRATGETAALIYIYYHFNPRPPWGGRRGDCAHIKSLSIISIHALRGEGDVVPSVHFCAAVHFNPRPPWGGRRWLHTNELRSWIFQSTPSVGRATLPLEYLVR